LGILPARVVSGRGDYVFELDDILRVARRLNRARASNRPWRVRYLLEDDDGDFGGGTNCATA